MTHEQLEDAIKERDSWRDEAKRLEIKLSDAIRQLERAKEVRRANTTPEPSRLEIAARIMQAFISSGAFVIDIPEQSLAYADALILRANYK
jgi:hypothetical protein